MRKLSPLPLPNKIPEVKKREPVVEPPHKKRAKVLVVDDDASIRKVISQELADYNIGTACDGTKGLELFKNGEFDLVVTDLKMPNMSGMELLAEIKMIDPDAKVIVISGHVDASEMEMLRQMGAALVLQKPMGVVEIADHVAKILPN
jgi:DNA-binding NtrC family response regulator